MDNYYAILGIEPNSTPEEIQKSLNEQSRKWGRRHTASELEHRQQAERMSKQLLAAAQVLLDPTCRAEYDRELNAAGAAPQRDSAAAAPDSGWPSLAAALEAANSALESGDAASAQTIVEEIARRAPNEPEAWRLLSAARIASGQGDAVVAAIKAVSLAPEDPAMIDQLADAYAASSRFANALEVLKRGIVKFPDVLPLKASFGAMQVRAGQTLEGTAVLEECARLAPDEVYYQRLLAYAYMDCARESWTFVSDERIEALSEKTPAAKDVLSVGWNATEAVHLENAHRWLDHAAALNCPDAQVKREIEEMKKAVVECSKRHFVGNWVMGGLAILLGGFMMFDDPVGIFYFIGAVAYLASSFPAFYVIKRRALRGDSFDDFGWMTKITEKFSAWWAPLVGILFLVSIIPVYAIWNVYRNLSDELKAIANHLWSKREDYRDKARSSAAWMFDKAKHASSAIAAPIPQIAVPEVPQIGAPVPMAAPETVRPALAHAPVAYPALAPPVESPVSVPPTSRSKLPLMGASLVVLAIVAGGILYWRGIIGDRPAAVAREINAALAAQHLEGVYVTVDRSWVATLSGTVVGKERAAQALAAVQGFGSVSSVTDKLTIKADVADVEHRLSDTLAQERFNSVSVKISEDYTATLTGTVDAESEKQRAAQLISRDESVRRVNNQISRSRAWVEKDLRNLLKSAGHSDISVAMSGDNAVSLVGRVDSQEAQQNIASLIQSYDAALQVANGIEVVAPPPPTVAAVAQRDRNARPVTATPVVATPVEQNLPASRPIRGSWVGEIHEGFSRFPVAIQINDGAVGDQLGEIGYRDVTGKPCGGVLRLVEVIDTRFIFEEKTTRATILCPGGGRMQLETSGAIIKAKWFRRKQPEKVRMSTELAKS